MNKILLVDGQNLAYRAKFKFNLSTPEGLDSSVFYGLIYVLKSYITRFNPTSIYIVFDGGRNAFRKEILPTYKTRVDKLGSDKEGFYQQIQDLVDLFPSMNVHAFKKKDQEADDYIYAIARKLNKVGNEVLIISSDKDFIPLLSPHIHTFNPFKDTEITLDNVEEIYGFDSKEFLDFLILDGDKSDTIRGVSGMGPKRIRAFLDEFGDIETFLDGETDLGNWGKYWEEIKTVYPINKKLIDLRYAYRLLFKRSFTDSYFESLMPIQWEDEALRTYFHKYRTGSFYRNSFLKSFKALR